jgi:hypothetical protein
MLALSAKEREGEDRMHKRIGEKKSAQSFEFA